MTEENCIQQLIEGTRVRRIVQLIVPLLIAVPAFAEDVNLEVINRIKAEAIRNSEVMEHLYALTDMNGPRLTGSPGLARAAESTARIMRSYGIESNVELAGEFGRAWSTTGVNVRMITPTMTPIHAVPMAWSGGTAGLIKGEVVSAPLPADPDDSSDLESLAHRIEKYQQDHAGQLTGKIVLLSEPIEFGLPGEPAASRYDDDALAEIFSSEPFGPMSPVTWPIWKYPANAGDSERNWSELPIEVKAEYWDLEAKVKGRLYDFFSQQGVVAVLIADDRGGGNEIFSDDYGSWVPGSPVPPTTLSLTAQDYNRIARLVDRDVLVELELDVDVTMSEDVVDLRNVVATIPGGRKRDEIVMLGGHLDSWHGAVGATDNAAGCAVVMEAMRILHALDLKMDRTVRMALWDGEEQNYYGSRFFVREHFGDPVTMQLKPAHSRLSAYYNVDNGAGRIRGIYLQSNDMARPIFEAWFEPLADLGVETVSIRDTSGTDHLVFDAVGLPGFQFIQDPLEYEGKTHHSNIDTVDHVVPEDLKQAAAVLAIVIYHTANRADLMPRKPLPPALPERVELPEILR